MTDILRAVRESTTLTLTQRAVIQTLAGLSNPTTGTIPEAHRPSREDLMRFASCSRATITRTLREIERAGWIERPRYGPRSAEIVAVLIPSKAHSEPYDDLAKAHSEPTDDDLGLTVSPAKAHSEPRTYIHGPYGPEEPSTPADADVPEVVDAELVDEKNLPAIVEDNAGTITAAWIDHCANNSVRLPRGIIGRYAKAIKTALDQGFTPNVIKTALARMLAEGVAGSPSYFENNLVRAQQGPSRRPRRMTPGEESAQDLAGGDAQVASLINDFFKETP